MSERGVAWYKQAAETGKPAERLPGWRRHGGMAAVPVRFPSFPFFKQKGRGGRSKILGSLIFGS